MDTDARSSNLERQDRDSAVPGPSTTGIQVQFTDELTDAQRQLLFHWAQDVFRVDTYGLQWRKKEWHILVYAQGLLVGHAGMIQHVVTVDHQRVIVAGIGGVVTIPHAQGRGFARIALENATIIMCDRWAVEFGLLFCLDSLVKLYEHLGWRRVLEPVIVDQPSGKLNSPLNVMVLPCRGQAWPKGTVDVCSLPW